MYQDAPGDIDWSWQLIYGSLLLSAKETHRKAQKHTECSYMYTVVILLSHFLGTETHWFSTWHGMVAAQIWLDIVYTGRWEGAEPSWFRASSLYQSELGQYGTTWLSTMLARFGHVYTATTNRAEPCWYCAAMVSSGSVNAALVLL